MADRSHQLVGCHCRAPGRAEPRAEMLSRCAGHSLHLPSLSALCPGAWLLRVPLQAPLPSVSWWGLGNGRYHQERGGRGKRLGYFYSVRPLFGDVSPEVAVSSLTTAPLSSLCSMVPVLSYHFLKMGSAITFHPFCPPSPGVVMATIVA